MITSHANGVLAGIQWTNLEDGVTRPASTTHEGHCVSDLVPAVTLPDVLKVLSRLFKDFAALLVITEVLEDSTRLPPSLDLLLMFLSPATGLALRLVLCLSFLKIWPSLPSPSLSLHFSLIPRTVTALACNGFELHVGWLPTWETMAKGSPRGAQSRERC